jgi:hypothetical protein
MGQYMERRSSSPIRQRWGERRLSSIQSFLKPTSNNQHYSYIYHTKEQYHYVSIQ